MSDTDFEWGEAKNLYNQESHGVSFTKAQHTFFDERRVIAEDVAHSQNESRYFCFGLNESQTAILTVRFIYRNGRIRIIGAGYWRKGKKTYEKANSVC
jgi:uncharacterized DUF497 family protein